jgi:thiol-disulfide isomerase/thioredoxin
VYAAGIQGQRAPDLFAQAWRGPDGVPLDALALADLPGRYKLLFFFQSWCPGCHSHGFPTLARIVDRTDRETLGAVVVQTVFEGFEENTAEEAWALQERLGLGVPFGHDATEPRSRTMSAYRTGGTPWFVLVDPARVVVANHFSFDADALVRYLAGA